MLPRALAYGISEERFFHSTPRRLRNIYKAIDKKRDYEMWIMGQYVADALWSTVCNGFIWRNKSEKLHEYPNSPYTFQNDKIEQNTNTESKEEIAVFEMKQRVKLLEQQGLPQSPM